MIAGYIIRERKYIMDIIREITQKQINPNVPEFRVGDTLRVDVRIIEGNKERIQAF